MKSIIPPESISARRIAGLKARLAVVAIISVGFIVGGVAMYLSGEAYLESRKKEENNLKGSISALAGQSTQMQQDAVEATDAIALSDYLKPLLGTNDFSLTRDVLTQRIRVLSEKFHLDEVGVRASGLKDESNSSVKLANGKEISMQIELEIIAPSDAMILRFVDALPVSLPGFVEISAFELSREGSLQPESMIAIAQGMKTTGAKAKLTFIWRGIRPNPPEPAAAPVPGMSALPEQGRVS